MSGVVDRLASHWASQRLAHGTPAEPRDVDAFEARYGVQLPSDLRTYFLAINGSESGMNGPMDEYLISFCHLAEVHPLSDVAPELGVPDGQHWFVIADHSIGVHLYVIRLSESAATPTTVAVVYNEFTVAIASSFDSFLEGYCDRDQDMLFPDVPPEWTAKYGAPAI